MDCSGKFTTLAFGIRCRRSRNFLSNDTESISTLLQSKITHDNTDTNQCHCLHCTRLSVPTISKNTHIRLGEFNIAARTPKAFRILSIIHSTICISGYNCFGFGYFAALVLGELYGGSCRMENVHNTHRTIRSRRMLQ